MSGLYPVVSTQSGAEQFAQEQSTLASLQNMIQTDIQTIASPNAAIADKVKAYQELSNYINGNDSRWTSLNSSFADEQKALLKSNLSKCLAQFNDIEIPVNFSFLSGSIYVKSNLSMADILNNWSTYSKDQQNQIGTYLFQHVDAGGNVVPHFDYTACFNDLAGI